MKPLTYKFLQSSFLACFLSATTLTHAGSGPGSGPDFSKVVKEFEVEVQDSENCGGGNADVQVVSLAKDLPGFCGDEVWVTVTATVEAQNNGFDIVTVNGVHFFEGNESSNECDMISKAALRKKVPVDSDGKLTLTYDTVDGLYHESGIATITKIEPVTGSDCSSCKGGGKGSTKNGCVDVTISLGNMPNGDSYGNLKIKYDTPDNSIYTPAGISYGSPNSSVEQTFLDEEGSLFYSNVNGSLVNLNGQLVNPTEINYRQIKTPQVLSDFVVLSDLKYEIRFYSPDAIGTKVSGLYQVTGTPFTVWTIENPDTTGATNDRVLVTEAPAGATPYLAEYQYIQAVNDWELVTGGGLKKESRSQTVDAATGDIIYAYTITDQNDAIVSYLTQQEHEFPWGTEIVKETDGVGAEMQTTVHTFYEDVVNDGDNYGKLKLTTNYDGSWVRYEYNAEGKVIKTVTPYLNSPSTASDDQCRVTETTYNSTFPEEMHVEKVLGVEVARSYSGEIIQDDYKESHSITCTVTGATYDDPTNQVSITRSINDSSSPFDGRTLRFVNSDGTGTIYQYEEVETDIITTVYSGTIINPFSLFPKVTKGTKTVTVVDELAKTLSVKTYDIETNFLISSQTNIHFDSLGRVLLARNDISGLETSTTYSCCGVETETDAAGNVVSYTYDSLRRKETATRNGITTRYTYDAMGRTLTTEQIGTDSSVIMLSSTTYDSVGMTETTTDTLGNTTTYSDSVDTDGFQISTTTLPDNSTQISKSYLDGSQMAVYGAAVRPQFYEYGINVDGQYTTQFNGADNTATQWVKSYTNFAGQQYKTIFADGAETRNYYDERGRVIKTVGLDGEITLFEYNDRGQQEISCLDMDRDSVIDYDGTDRITRAVSDYIMKAGTVVRRNRQYSWQDANSDTETLVSTSESSVDGLRNWSTSYGLTATSKTEYIGGDNNTVKSTSFSPNGTWSESVSENGRQAVATNYASDGSIISQRSYTYDAHGRMAAVTDARNGATTYTYYDNGQVKSVTTPDPGASGAAQTTQFVYNTRGQQITITKADGTVVHNEYFPTGELKKTYTTGSGTSGTYPVEYTYDDAGRRTTMTTYQDYNTQSGASVTTWNYDPQRGFLLSKLYNDGKGTSYTYTDGGKLKTRTWARGIITTYDYDNAGQQRTITYSNEPDASNLTPQTSYTFNRLGQMESVSDAAGTREFTYDDRGQLLMEALKGTIVTRTYDLYSRPDSVTFTQDDTELNAYSYSYDFASRLKSVLSGQTNVSYSYLPNSNLVGSVSYNHNGSEILNTTNTFDNMNRHLTIDSKVYGKTVNYRNYTYNNANQRTAVVRKDGSKWDYTYDSLGQVASANKSWDDQTAVDGASFGYTYDDIGNRKTSTRSGNQQTYTPNLLNQYDAMTASGIVDIMGEASEDATVTVNGAATSRKGRYYHAQVEADNSVQAVYEDITVTGEKTSYPSESSTGKQFFAKTPVSFTYDDDGNTLSDGRWQYTWNAENRLVAMETLPALTSVVTPQKLEFTYDYMGRRISKKVYIGSPGYWTLATTNLFLYDGYLMVHQTTNNHQQSTDTTESFVWYGSKLLLMTNDSGTNYYCHDANKNVVALVSTAGVITAEYEYSPFGELIKSYGVMTTKNKFRFSNEYVDDETNLVYYNYRYYNPAHGKWLSRDPIAEKGGLNLYAMINNDLVNDWDYIGLITFKEYMTLRDKFTKALKGKTCPEAEAALKKEDKNILDGISEDGLSDLIDEYNDNKDNAGKLAKKNKKAQKALDKADQLGTLIDASRVFKDYLESSDKDASQALGSFKRAYDLTTSLVPVDKIPIIGQFIEFYGDAMGEADGAIKNLSKAFGKHNIELLRCGCSFYKSGRKKGALFGGGR